MTRERQEQVILLAQGAIHLTRAIGAFNPHMNGESWKPRPCSICTLQITEVLAYNQSAHPGACKAEQTRRYLAKQAEALKKKRATAKIRPASAGAK